MPPSLARRPLLLTMAAVAVLFLLALTVDWSFAGRGAFPAVDLSPAPDAALRSKPALEKPTAATGVAAFDEDGAARRTVASGPRALRGRVIDAASGEPVFRATFYGRTGDASTNRKGEFRYAEEDSGGYPFVVEAKGYGYLHGELGAPAGSVDEPLLFPLVASSAVRGRIIDSDGYPLRHALIRLVRSDGAEGFPEWSPAAGSPAGSRQVPEGYGMRFLSDEDGRFTLGGLVPHSSSSALRITKHGFYPELVAVSAPVPGASIAVEVTMRREHDPGFGELAGTVLLNGKPCQARLDWRTEEGQGHGSSNEDGFFRLDLPAGQIHVVAVPDGWRVRGGVLEIAGDRAERHVLEGSRTWLDLQLTIPMAVIAGSVTFDDGEPCVRRPVYARSESGHSFRVVTDAVGEFWIELPDVGEEFTVYPGAGGGTATRERVLPGTRGVHLVITPHDD